MVFTGEAAIVFSFVTTRGKTYSIAWISHGLDVSVILLTKSFNLWYSGHELICCCCYSLAKLHNSLQLVECAPTNHSQRVVFSTNHEKNKNQSLWPAVSSLDVFFTTVNTNRCKVSYESSEERPHSIWSFSIIIVKYLITSGCDCAVRLDSARHSGHLMEPASSVLSAAQ